MSIPQSVSVACTKCGYQMKTTIFQSINTNYANDVPQKIISGDLFVAKCPHCNKENHLEYNLLYNDIKHKAMVYVIHRQDDDFEKQLTQLRDSSPSTGGMTRLVSNMNELREKVACLEAGLDDRIVELCKAQAIIQALSNNPEYKFSNSFFTYIKDEGRIYLYDKSGNEQYCYLDMENYNWIKERFTPALKKIESEPYMLYDEDWGTQFFIDHISDSEANVTEEMHQEASRVNGETIENQETQESLVKEEAKLTEEVATEELNRKDYQKDVAVPSQNQMGHTFESATDSSIFCRRCGKKMPADSSFCNKCGTPVIIVDSTEKKALKAKSGKKNALKSFMTFVKSNKISILFGSVAIAVSGIIALVQSAHMETTGGSVAMMILGIPLLIVAAIFLLGVLIAYVNDKTKDD